MDDASEIQNSVNWPVEPIDDFSLSRQTLWLDSAIGKGLTHFWGKMCCSSLDHRSTYRKIILVEGLHVVHGYSLDRYDYR